MVLTRRDVLVAGCAGYATVRLLPVTAARAGDEAIELVEQMTRHKTTPSDRLRLLMPVVFPNGYTVPLALEVDSPMTELDHVRQVRIFAPRNPIIEVAGFRFAPLRSVARVSTRIRLAAPQHVVAVAEMNDGVLLRTQTFVDVATNGCV